VLGFIVVVFVGGTCWCCVKFWVSVTVDVCVLNELRMPRLMGPRVGIDIELVLVLVRDDLMQRHKFLGLVSLVQGGQVSLPSSHELDVVCDGRFGQVLGSTHTPSEVER
jgi:hypothetical protein